MRAIKGSALLMFALITLGVSPARAHQDQLGGTIDELLDLGVRPFAIAHHGFGDNMGEDPTRPIENTVPAVRRAFRAGVSVVEVDVQLTADRQVAVFHDDFLSDFTCLNRLTLAELQERLPFVPSLQAVLNEARQFNQGAGPLRGLMIVELKAVSPLCDPEDTQEHAIVSAVTGVIRRMRMTKQVMLMSFSPALLYLASQQAPEIARDLGIFGVQFLSLAEVQAVFPNDPVTIINKKLNLGLQWAEIGSLFRLPGYRSVDEVLATAVAVQARVVEADLAFLQSAGMPFVDTLHRFGLKAFGFTATNPDEWFFLQSHGLDGVYTDDIPFGVEHQAPIPPTETASHIGLPNDG
jgi:glycerophosphoryl diester phosphodiesterase